MTEEEKILSKLASELKELAVQYETIFQRYINEGRIKGNSRLPAMVFVSLIPDEDKSAYITVSSFGTKGTIIKMLEESYIEAPEFKKTIMHSLIISSVDEEVKE